MPTQKELAKAYAQQIRQAKRSSVTKTAMAKSRQETEKLASAAYAEFKAAVGAVLKSVDGLVYTQDQRRVPKEYQEAVLNLVDEELDLPDGTMVFLKKGSVEMSIDYHNSIMQMMQRITYK